MKRLNTFAKVVILALVITLVNGCFLGTKVFEEVAKENVTESEISTQKSTTEIVTHQWSAGATASIYNSTTEYRPVKFNDNNDAIGVSKDTTYTTTTPSEFEETEVVENSDDVENEKLNNVTEQEDIPIEEESVESTEQDYDIGNIITVPSVKIRLGNKYLDTNPITVNVDKLMEVYSSSEEVKLDWDYKDIPEVWMTVWEFLVNQQGIDPVYAAAICGNISHEGWFGMEEGTYKVFKNMNDVRSKLGDGDRGYGIVQWTYYTRQNNLLAYYEAVNSFGLDWEATMIIAECCCMLEEIRLYDFFYDIHDCDTMLELATGTIAVEYESYSGSKSQWSKTDGGYRLVTDNSNGAKRLNYAWKIYYHFGGQ